MKKFTAILVLLIFVGGMYYFSSQTGDISTQQSNTALNIVEKIREKVTLKDEKIISIKEKVFNKLKQYGSKGYVVRKLAHFSIYACIGLAMAYVIYLFSQKVIVSATLSILLTSMYAYYDEYRQLSVAGRSGSLSDVFIDSSGAFVGVCIFIFIVGSLKSAKTLFRTK